MKYENKNRLLLLVCFLCSGLLTETIAHTHSSLSELMISGCDAADDFNAGTYSGGSDWSNNWTEVGETTSASSGLIQNTGTRLSFTGSTGSNPYIRRTVDLSSAITAILKFDLTGSNLESTDIFEIQISSNGGTSWTTLATYPGTSAGNKSVSITPYLSANTVIRYGVNTGTTDISEFFYIDNVEITSSCTSGTSQSTIGQQVLTNWNCHALSENNPNANYYFSFDPSTGTWVNVGGTGTVSIEAIAYNPEDSILYATNAGDFGYINLSTGAFVSINSTLSVGTTVFSDVDGLTYDPTRDIIWASERKTGTGVSDLLFQIDPATGAVIANAFGTGVHYLTVPNVTDPVTGVVYDDVDDIAYDPYTNNLYAIQNKFGTGGLLSILDITTGAPTIVGVFTVDDIEGLGITYFGGLYGTSGNNGPDPNDSNRFYYIDKTDGTTTLLNPIDPNNIIKDFESFDCFSSYNDLAIRKTVVASQPTPIESGDVVTFELEIFNQGTMNVIDVEVTDYIPTGLTLVSSNWTQSGSIATTTIPNLTAGDSITLTIDFAISPTFIGNITNTAEISNTSYLSGTDTIPIPDIDSVVDQDPNNDTTTDNELDGGGPALGEDEDDSDIATINVVKPCPQFSFITEDTILCPGGILSSISVGITLGASQPDTIQLSYFTNPADSTSIWGGGGTSLGQVISSTSDTITLNNPTLPAHSGGSGNDTLYVYAYWQPTPIDVTCRPLDSMQIIIAPNPTTTAIATDPTCTNNSAITNNDGTITLAGFTTEKYDLVMGSSYTGSATYATATAIPTDGVISNSLPNPSGIQPYTIRVFNSSGCYIDRTVSINPIECCGPKKCVPASFTIRNGSSN